MWPRVRHGDARTLQQRPLIVRSRLGECRDVEPTAHELQQFADLLTTVAPFKIQII